MDDLVSIITPVYNAEDYIVQMIESVLKQSYTNWELILIDDFSKDRSYEKTKKYLSDKRIKYIKLSENRGAANARNKGIEIATGKYIAFLDSDDLWYKDKLIKQLNFMKENNVTITFTYYDKINEFGENLNEVVKNTLVIDYDRLLKECPGNSTVIYNAEYLGKNYVPLIKKRNDYLMWFNIIKKSNTINGLDEVLSSHRIVSNSLSSNKRSLIKYHWEIYRKHEKINIIKSIYLINYWILKTIFKRRKKS